MSIDIRDFGFRQQIYEEICGHPLIDVFAFDISWKSMENLMKSH